jgi:hypothetical protein
MIQFDASGVHIVDSSNVSAWASSEDSVHRFKDGDDRYHYDKVNDRIFSTCWIAASTGDENIGIYFTDSNGNNEEQELFGFGFKWLQGYGMELDARQRGLWTLYYTRDTISSISDAENATYYIIQEPFFLDDPNPPSITHPAELHFRFDSPLLASGLKANISRLDEGTGYYPALAEFIAYLQDPAATMGHIAYAHDYDDEEVAQEFSFLININVGTWLNVDNHMANGEYIDNSGNHWYLLSEMKDKNVADNVLSSYNIDDANIYYRRDGLFIDVAWYSGKNHPDNNIFKTSLLEYKIIQIS